MTRGKKNKQRHGCIRVKNQDEQKKPVNNMRNLDKGQAKYKCTKMEKKLHTPSQYIASYKCMLIRATTKVSRI